MLSCFIYSLAYRAGSTVTCLLSCLKSYSLPPRPNLERMGTIGQRTLCFSSPLCHFFMLIISPLCIHKVAIMLKKSPVTYLVIKCFCKCFIWLHKQLKKELCLQLPKLQEFHKFTTKVVYVGVKHVWLLVMVCHQNASQQFTSHKL